MNTNRMHLDCGPCALRDWRPGDEERLSEIASDRDVSRYMTARFPYPYTLDDAKWWIGENAGENATNFAVIVEGRIAGGCGYAIGEYERAIGAEIGYWLGRAYWGRGIATEVLKHLTDYAFARHDGLRRLQATIYAPNVASARVAEKCGYTREGVLRKAVAKDGRIWDALIYAIISAD